MTEGRLEMLQDYKRIVRQYEKNDMEHWEFRILEQRRKTDVDEADDDIYNSEL